MLSVLYQTQANFQEISGNLVLKRWQIAKYADIFLKYSTPAFLSVMPREDIAGNLNSAGIRRIVPLMFLYHG